MAADKIIQTHFAEIERELDKGEGSSASVATAIVKQLGKTLVSEMKSNQDFHDRIAQIVDPAFMLSPVAVLQRSGAKALTTMLDKLPAAQIKKVGTGRNLVATYDLSGLGKPQMIELIVNRAEKEAAAQKKF